DRGARHPRPGRGLLPRRPHHPPSRRSRRADRQRRRPRRQAGDAVRDPFHQRAEVAGGRAGRRAMKLIFATALAAAVSTAPLPAAADTIVKVGSKTFTENVILGEIVTLLARDAGVP